MKALLLLVLTLFHSSLAYSAPVELGEIVTSEEAGRFCDGVDSSGACLVDWAKALRYCRERGSHLPTAFEYASSLTQFGIRLLSVDEFTHQAGFLELMPSEISGLPRKDGYYLVACEPNQNAADTTFYMNDFAYARPAGLPGNHKIWTASSPPGHPEAAHVVYDEWGGGGGKPVEHLKNQLNALRCVR